VDQAPNTSDLSDTSVGTGASGADGTTGATDSAVPVDPATDDLQVTDNDRPTSDGTGSGRAGRAGIPGSAGAAPSTNQTVLSAHKISKVFWIKGAKHPLHVFSGVSLTLRAGEMLALVGPSGSGKSTLLRCLAGLEHVNEGHVVLLETNLARASRATLAAMLRENVGLLLINPPLVPSLTALQNVELPGQLAGRSAWSNHQLALRTLDELGARDLAKKSPEQLTPPQAAKVSLARLLTQHPKIIFADEPTGRLSTTDSKLVLSSLKKLAATGTAVVLATHDLHLASKADHVITVVDGALGATLEHPSAEEILQALDQTAYGDD
jgi:putative ABC transport system ATP-binding protein